MTLRTALILGAAVWPGGRPSPTLERRTRHALDLWRAGRVDRIICCGGVGRHPPSEAEVMARILREGGVPEDAILCEDRSVNTWENIAHARAICPDLGPVILVTDRYHQLRARLIARHLGLRAQSEGPPATAVAKGARLRAHLRESAALIKMVWHMTIR